MEYEYEIKIEFFTCLAIIMDDGCPVIDFRNFPNETQSDQTLSQIYDITGKDPTLQSADVNEHFNIFFNVISDSIPDVPEDVFDIYSTQ